MGKTEVAYLDIRKFLGISKERQEFILSNVMGLVGMDSELVLDCAKDIPKAFDSESFYVGFLMAKLTEADEMNRGLIEFSKDKKVKLE